MSNSIHLHSCAGCGGKSWGDDGRCDYCGGNVKKSIIPPQKNVILSGTNDARSDQFKKYWMDSMLGVNVGNCRTIYYEAKIFEL